MFLWFLFLFFTVLHLYANYKVVTSLIFDTLNDRRANIIITRYLDDALMLSPSDMAANEPIFQCMLSIICVIRWFLAYCLCCAVLFLFFYFILSDEPIFDILFFFSLSLSCSNALSIPPIVTQPPIPITLGVPFRTAFANIADYSKAISECSNQYAISVDQSKKSIGVVLSKSASPSDILQAYYHAHTLRKVWSISGLS